MTHNADCDAAHPACGAPLETVLIAHWEIVGNNLDGFQCTCGYGLGDGSGDLDGRHIKHVSEVIGACAAKAWDKGYEAGYDISNWEDRGSGERPDYPNPYRPTSTGQEPS